MIYRIAETRDWQAAQAAGYFASADLAAEGFIHCCTAQQVAGVVQRDYQGHEGLLLLEIDETRVQEPIRWEDLTNAGQLLTAAGCGWGYLSPPPRHGLMARERCPWTNDCVRDYTR
jgi:hypothetical protein